MKSLFSGFSKSKSSKSSKSSKRSVSGSGTANDDDSPSSHLDPSASASASASASGSTPGRSPGASAAAAAGGGISPSASTSNLHEGDDAAAEATTESTTSTSAQPPASSTSTTTTTNPRSGSGSSSSTAASASRSDINGVPPGSGTPPSSSGAGAGAGAASAGSGVGRITPSTSSTGLASDGAAPAGTAGTGATQATPTQSTRRGFLGGRSSKSSMAAAAALQSAQETGGVGTAGSNNGSGSASSGNGTGAIAGTGAGTGTGTGTGTSTASSGSSTTPASGAASTLSPQDIPTTQTILANPLQPSPSNGYLSSNGHSSAPLSTSTSHLTPSSAGGGIGLNPSSSTHPSPSGGIQLSLPGDKHSRTFDVDEMISRLLDAGYTGKVTKSVCLKNAEITAICLAAREVFLSQPTLIELSPPVKIVGDVHGQYSDLIRLFEMCGFPPQANFLFLGDYVDRGKQSLETILLLMCYKIKYPENFFLLRGNHECANVTRVYGFYDECKRRCNIKIWKTFIDVFNCLPICAIVASKIFCVHGGLSPSLTSMDDIRRISRPVDVPDYGLLNDLLWSDPSDTALDWEDNERGVSYCFGRSVIQEFLARYDFDLICRAHMVVEDGYEFWQDRMLVTIFSAPNYCGEFQNFAAVMSVSEDLLCAFELLKPLDGPALKKEMARNRRRASGVPGIQA